MLAQCLALFFAQQCDSLSACSLHFAFFKSVAKRIFEAVKQRDANMLELMPERLGLGEFSSQEVSISGRAFVADMSGALYWPSQRAIVVADLVVAASGREQDRTGFQAGQALTRLADVIDAYEVETVLVLGSGIATVADRERDGTEGVQIEPEVSKTLAIMQDHCRWIWISDAQRDHVTHARVVGGQSVSRFAADGIRIRHFPSPGVVTHEVAGGFSPFAAVSRHGHIIRRPCFIANGLRAVLPTFASVTGARNVLDDAFATMFGGSRLDVRILGHEGLCPIAPRLLIDRD